ncbi:uncharacterized protein METZ01_LOCUS476523, partial [marine metagenome]
NAEDGQVVALTIGSTPINASATVAGGVWTATVDISALADGNIDITADVSDLAGNPATQATKTLIKETVIPTLAIDNPLMTDNKVNDVEKTAVVISGTSNAGNGQRVALAITDGVTAIKDTVILTGGGVWTHTEDISSLADGNIVIKADVSDLAGNAAIQVPRTLVKDTYLPSIAIGVIEDDDIVNDSEQADVVISGTADTEDNLTVTLRIAGSIIGTPTVTDSVWSYPVNMSPLADGNITITAD